MDRTISVAGHAEKRLAQRGFRVGDVEKIIRIGTEVEGSYLVLEKDLERVECESKESQERLRRLAGKRVVLNGSHLVTVYHARPGKQARLLRR